MTAKSGTGFNKGYHITRIWYIASGVTDGLLSSKQGRYRNIEMGGYCLGASEYCLAGNQLLLELVSPD
jgi:hypothetical protein